jgi:hypothetical protein
MRVLDVRWVRLAIAAGAIVGSALVSSVAVAADESPPPEPPATPSADVSSIEVEQNGADVIVVDPSPGTPLEEIAVIEIVAPDPEVIGSGTVDPTVVEPVAPTDGEESADEPIAMTASEPASATSLAMETIEAESDEGEEGEHGSDHEGGSGGEGSPYHMTFTVVWYDADGKQITTLDATLTAEVLAQFGLSASSQTGKGNVTSATCTYPDGSLVLRCEFDNPGHGSGSDGMIIPARPMATYTVTVDEIAGWTISGAGDDPYSARDLCPRGGEGGHEEGGHEEGGHEEGGHDAAALEEGGHEEGGHEEGGHEEGGHEGGSVPCVHIVEMHRVEPPPPPTQPPAAPAPESGVVPAVTTPVATTTTAPSEPEPAAQSFATAPSSLPATGGSIAMIVFAAGVLLAMGSALAGLTRRTS